MVPLGREIGQDPPAVEQVFQVAHDLVAAAGRSGAADRNWDGSATPPPTGPSGDQATTGGALVGVGTHRRS